MRVGSKFVKGKCRLKLALEPLYIYKVGCRQQKQMVRYRVVSSRVVSHKVVGIKDSIKTVVRRW